MKSPGDLARSLRKTPTRAEQTLWRLLRDRRFAGFKFRRQHPVGPYVLDFYCVSAKLAVEVDGDVHGIPSQKNHDVVRDAYLMKQGIRMLRFWNLELAGHMEGVLDTIFGELSKSVRNPHPNPLPNPLPWKGRGEPSTVSSPRLRGVD